MNGARAAGRLCTSRSMRSWPHWGLDPTACVILNSSSVRNALALHPNLQCQSSGTVLGVQWRNGSSLHEGRILLLLATTAPAVIIWRARRLTDGKTWHIGSVHWACAHPTRGTGAALLADMLMCHLFCCPRGDGACQTRRRGPRFRLTSSPYPVRAGRRSVRTRQLLHSQEPLVALEPVRAISLNIQPSVSQGRKLTPTPPPPRSPRTSRCRSSPQQILRSPRSTIST